MRKMFDATVRVERLFYLPGTLSDPECPVREFEDEFVDCLPEGSGSALYAQLPALARWADAEDYPDWMDVSLALFQTPGFLVQAATPVRDKHGSFSWGHYWTEWLYAPTEADIATVCIEWAATKVVPPPLRNE